MDKVFLTILNMSLTGAFVIAAICLARLPLKKAPKIISYCLWAVAGFRLVFPFSIESVFSLLPFKAQPIPPDIATQAVPRIDSGIPLVNNAVSGLLPAASPTASANPLQIWTAIGAWVWVVGVAVLLIYGAVSFFILKVQMRNAAYVEASIYEAENIKSPFVLGVFKPRIYLPIGLSEQEKSYIILHEQTHIKRHDHIVKFGAYFILCLHWFNPLAWIAFLLMGVDMEMSCDERVLKELGGETKHDYSRSLLSLATEKRVIGGSPLAFSEGGIKQRIKNVLNFRKPSRVVIALAVALAAVLSIGFAVNMAAGHEPLSLGTYVTDDGLTQVVFHGVYEFYIVRSGISYSPAGYWVYETEPNDDKVILICTDEERYIFSYQAVRLTFEEGAWLEHWIDPGTVFTRSEEHSDVLSQSSTVPAITYEPTKWLDYYNPRGDGPIPYDRTLELELPEFPETAFTWTAYEVKAIDVSGERVLFGGWPIHNVFLADLNGDELPELCATVSRGSGIIDTRVIVYDCANDKAYDLSDRMYFDYSLSIDDGQLVVTQTRYSENGSQATGSVAIKDGELVTFGIDRTIPEIEPQETTPPNDPGYFTDPVEVVKAELEADGCVILNVFAVDWATRQYDLDGKDYEFVSIYAEYLAEPFGDAIYIMNYTMRRPADDTTAEWKHDEPVFWDGIAYGVAKYAAEQYYTETGRTVKITGMKPVTVDDKAAYVAGDMLNWQTVVFSIEYENDPKSHPQHIAVLVSQDGQSHWLVSYWSGITPLE